MIKNINLCFLEMGDFGLHPLNPIFNIQYQNIRTPRFFCNFHFLLLEPLWNPEVPIAGTLPCIPKLPILVSP